MNPQYPLYIVSKGRWDSRLTSKALESMKVPYHIVVEEQEFDKYADVIDKDKILILDKQFQDDYDTFDNLGRTKSIGPGAARNFVWQHSMDRGFKRHWVMDDNINGFYRFNKNRQIQLRTGAGFKAMEDFSDRYTNVAMSGPNYYMFASRKSKLPPFVMNTRIYSCNLILNEVDYRWRGRYNEDTDLSLRMLKDGWCTVQYNAFLQQKISTQLVKGGNTKEFYNKEGTLPKSKMQVAMHPDVSRISWRFNRWHHHVDYTGFKKNKLQRRKDSKRVKGKNEYGMMIKDIIQ